MIRALLALLLLAVVLPAHASERTLAVLPLTRGVGEARYEGLGDALAGMIVSDLSAAPGLTLVERQRLDALLSEIELGESGFIAEGSAQRLGRGVGAGTVLVGTWSVVDGTLALDARLVEVEAGTIAHATAAQGPVADFVAVEKQLVEGLLDALEADLPMSARRRVLLQAPTESFDAFAAWSEGLAAERADRLDAAREAFARAVAADPDFTAARDAAGRIQAAVERARDRAADASDARRDRILDAWIAGASPLRRRDPPTTTDALLPHLLRWMALTDRREDCTVADEVRAWLDALGDAPLPPEHEVRTAVRERAAADGLQAVAHDLPAPAPAKDRPDSRGVRYVTWAGLTGADLGLRDLDQRDGLAGALLRCHTGEARVDAMDALARRAAEQAPADATYARLPLATAVELHALHLAALTRGPTPDLEARLASVVAATADDDAVRGRIAQRVSWIGRDADRTRTSRIRRAGASPARLTAFARALANADDAVIVTGTPRCDLFLRHDAPRVAASASVLDREAPGTSSHDNALDMIGDVRRAWALAGCLRGVEGPWSEVEALLAGVRAAVDRASDADPHGLCASNQASLAPQLTDAHLERIRSYDSTDAWTWAVLTQYTALVSNSCLDVRPREFP